jgi:hypothetical protein
VGVWPGVVVVPVELPVAVPVVEAAPAPAPAEAPPAAPAAPPAPPPPAANAQLEDMASTVAMTIVVIFMTFVSLFISKDKDCRHTTLQIGSTKLSSATTQMPARLADALAGLRRKRCAGSGIANAGAHRQETASAGQSRGRLMLVEALNEQATFLFQGHARRHNGSGT